VQSKNNVNDDFTAQRFIAESIQQTCMTFMIWNVNW